MHQKTVLVSSVLHTVAAKYKLGKIDTFREKAVSIASI